MKSPTIEKESESDMFDSDETLVTESQEHKSKKKPCKRQSEDTQNTQSEASQSLLMAKKKKYSEISEDSGLDNEIPEKKKKSNTVDFLTQEIFQQPTSENYVNSLIRKKKKYHNDKSSDDSEYTKKTTKKIEQEKEFTLPVNHEMLSLEQETKKNEKKKVSGLNSLNISKDNTFDSTFNFGVQELFMQISSQDIVNSPLRKSKKKKSKDPNINISEDSDGTASSLMKIKKELSSSNNHSLKLDSSEHVSKKHKKKKLTVEFGAQELFKQPSSEEFGNSPSRKNKKKKSKDQTINFSDNSDGISSITKIKKEFSLPKNHTLEFSSSEHVPKKHKKNKLNELNLPNLSEDDDSVEFNAQELFKQPSSEEFGNSPSGKSKKEKSKRPTINFSDDNEGTISSIKKSKKELSLHTLELSSSEHVPKKHKKKKLSGLNLSNLSDDTVEFGAQELFKQPSSEDFGNSPPRKSKKKKCNDSNINLSDNSDNTPSLIKKIKKERDSPIKHSLELPSSEHVIKKDKKKRINELNISNLREEDNTVEFGAQNIFKLSSSDEIVNSTSKKIKKKKEQFKLHDKDNGDNFTFPANNIKQLKGSLNYTENDTDLAKKDKKKKSKDLNSMSLYHNDIIDIFKLPAPEEFFNSTPKKKKRKESEENSSDVNDSKMSPIKVIRQDNDSNVTIDDPSDVNLTEPLTKKVKKKRNKGGNLSETSQDSNTLKHADSFDNSFSSDNSQRDKLHHNFNISSDNSQVFSELEDSEIDVPCRKHKKKKHKEVVSNNISGSNGLDVKSQHFFCQFCISSVNNVRRNDSKTDNEDILGNRNGFEKSDKKTKKKKRESSVSENASGKNNGIVDLLDKYLDNEEAWADDDNLPTTEVKSNSSCLADNKINVPLCDVDRATDIGDKSNYKPVDQNDNKNQKNKEKPKVSIHYYTVEDENNEILDSLLDTGPSKDDNNGGQDILGSTRTTDKSDEVDQTNNENIDIKQENIESLNKTIDDGHNDILDTRPSNDDYNDDQDIVDVNRYNSESSEDDTVSQKKAAKNKDKTKLKDPIGINFEDSQNRSQDESNVSENISSLARRSSDSSSVSIDLGEDLDQSGSESDRSKSGEVIKSTQKEKPKRKRKPMRICSVPVIAEDSQSSSDDETNSSRNNSNSSRRKNSSGRKNGNARSDDSDSDSDEGVEKLDKGEILKSAIKNISIHIDFPVPELHKICNRASKPTPQQRMEAKEKKIPVKLGKFVKAEDEKIIENWKRFIQVHNLEDIPAVFFSLGKQNISSTEKQNFLYSIARGFNERPPFYVYRRFKILMSSLKGGKFTEEEDQYILTQVEETRCHRNYISDIAQHLQRPCHSIEKRIKRLRDKHKRKIRWKKSNLVAFIKYLLKATNTDPDDVEALKDKHITSKQWIRLSAKLDNVPIRILKRAWLEKIHPMLFIPDKRCDLRDVKLKLIKMFCENKEYDWRGVNWSSYASHFEGLTGLRLYAVMKTLTLHKIPLEKRNNLKECIKILSKLKKEDLSRNYSIYKIKYQDGKIIQLGKNKKKPRKTDDTDDKQP